MTQKIRIVVAGIGGVGGYFGGLLAKAYQDSNQVEIVFLARGEHLNRIRQHGLKVIKGTTTFTARPFLATDHAPGIGPADLIMICTKSYDLETVLEQLKPCISANTILLPLLNGVDGTEKIRELLPGSMVPEGCVYIVSRLKEAGIVENSGNIQKLCFGLPGTTDERLLLFENIMKEAGIEASLSSAITSIVWEKFIFISATATATAYFDTCIGKLLEENKETLIRLIGEVKQIALAKGIAVDENITSGTLAKLETLPYQATSSMHSDFQQHKPKTELESLTGYVLQAGQKLGIPTPAYDNAYHYLKKKMAANQV